jgi:hypothetical protein
MRAIYLKWDQTMRISGAFFISLLLAVGFMLYLGGRDATSSLDAITSVADGLRETGVSAHALDRDLALQMVAAMEDLLAAPDTVGEHVEDLTLVATTAASWAAGAPAPSAELRAAVALRSAAGALRAQALSPSTVNLMRARRHLGAARAALESGIDGIGGPGPGLATGAIRDQLENLEQSREERHQELDEALKR